MVGIATAIVIALAGCGGGGGNSSATTAGGGENSATSVAADEFVKKADAICTKGKEQGLTAMASYLKQHEGAGKPKAAQLVKAIHTVFLPQLQKQTEEIRALGLPEGEEKQAEAFLEAMEEGVETASGSSSSVQFAQGFQKSAALAGELGIEACVYGG